MRKHIQSSDIIRCASSSSKIFRDLTGLRFGRLLVKGLYGIHKIHYYYTCLCDCGKSKIVSGSSIKRGHIRSCGCLRVEAARISLRTNRTKNRSNNGLITHGMSNTRIYGQWFAMRYRCTSPKCKAYKNYGGRGLKVCERWLHSFENFYADMGECPPNLTLERRDNNSGYNPDNCYWATRKQQTRNQRTNRIITFNGVTMCASDWDEHLGLRQGTVASRIGSLGWSEEKALSTPLRKPKNQ